jgi:hypothetical protein
VSDAVAPCVAFNHHDLPDVHVIPGQVEESVALEPVGQVLAHHHEHELVEHLALAVVMPEVAGAMKASQVVALHLAA